MTVKRFISEDNCCGYYTEIIDNEKELDLSLFNPKKNLTIEELVDLLNELHEENKELKKELQTYRKVAGCFNCHYHNYDWFDDGDEFEVCDKGNDVTEGICEEWEEL